MTSAHSLEVASSAFITNINILPIYFKAGEILLNRYFILLSQITSSIITMSKSRPTIYTVFRIFRASFITTKWAACKTFIFWTLCKPIFTLIANNLRIIEWACCAASGAYHTDWIGINEISRCTLSACSLIRTWSTTNGTLISITTQ